MHLASAKTCMDNINYMHNRYAYTLIHTYVGYYTWSFQNAIMSVSDF